MRRRVVARCRARVTLVPVRLRRAARSRARSSRAGRSARRSTSPCASPPPAPATARARRRSSAASCARARTATRPRQTGKLFLAPQSVDLWRWSTQDVIVYDGDLTVRKIDEETVQVSTTEVARLGPDGRYIEQPAGTKATMTLGHAQGRRRVAHRPAARRLRPVARLRPVRPHLHPSDALLRHPERARPRARLPVVPQRLPPRHDAGPGPARPGARLSPERRRAPACRPTPGSPSTPCPSWQAAPR